MTRHDLKGSWDGSKTVTHLIVILDTGPRRVFIADFHFAACTQAGAIPVVARREERAPDTTQAYEALLRVLRLVEAVHAARPLLHALATFRHGQCRAVGARETTVNHPQMRSPTLRRTPPAKHFDVFTRTGQHFATLKAVAYYPHGSLLSFHVESLLPVRSRESSGTRSIRRRHIGDAYRRREVRARFHQIQLSTLDLMVPWASILPPGHRVLGSVRFSGRRRSARSLSRSTSCEQSGYSS